MWDVRVCVACLATGVRMYSMSANSLQPYQLLAGVQFGDLIDYLPKKLCWECAALVNKFNLFRHKCERAYLLLQDIYNQHDEITEQYVNEANRERNHLSSPLRITRMPSYTVNDRNAVRLPSSPNSVTLTPSYAVNSQNIATKDTSLEHPTYSVKPEVDIVKVEYSCPKSEPGFKSEPFIDDVMVEYLEDDDEEEGVENDVEEVIESEETFKYVVIVTKEGAPPPIQGRPCSSGKKEKIPPDAWTEIILTQEQVNELHKQKKNSLEFEKAKLKCEECCQIFNKPLYLMKHMLKHELSSGSYECDFCKLRYKTRRLLMRHRNGHMRNYKCNICNTNLISLALAKSHYRQHQKLRAILELQGKREAASKRPGSKLKRKVKNKQTRVETVACLLTQEQMMEVVRKRQLAKGYDTAPFKCHLCYKVFLENRTYSQHMTLHDPVSGEYECDICKIRLRTRQKVFDHITSYHIRKYTCSICSSVSYTRSSANCHYQLHKGVRHMCHVCAATFRRETTMQLHIHKKHPAFSTSNVCGECGTSFPTYRGLVCHKQQMHQVPTLPEENAPYCEECKVQFASTKAWTKHVLNSDRHKDLQKDIANGCIQCGETFNTNAALRRHRKEQHPNKNHIRKDAIIHMKPQPCSLCGEWMTSAQGHWAHYRRCHPGQPYPRITREKHTCERCGRRFSAKTELDQHKMVHSGPPPLQCSLCPKAFYMEQSLKRHLSITHSEERPYQCDSCGMSFKLKHALKRHLYVHTGEKLYACNICEKGFTSRVSMRLHVRKMHNKEHIPNRLRVRKRKSPV